MLTRTTATALLTLTLIIALTGCCTTLSVKGTVPAKCATCPQAASCPYAGCAQPIYRHIVLLKFKDGTTEDQIKTIEQAFLKIGEKIDTVKAVEGGRNSSPEKLDQGFTHCFLVTFADAAGRDVYLPHQGHKEFVALMSPSLDKVLVIDYTPIPVKK